MPSAAPANRGVAARDAGGRVTTETVEAVSGSGEYVILGSSVPTRAHLTLQVGDAVSVLWRDDRPFMILDLQSRKGSGVDDVEEGGEVEELICAPLVEADPNAPDFPNTDIWFRNATRVDLLDLRTLLGLDTVDFGPSRGWGPKGRYFLVQGGPSGSATFHVIKLSGNPSDPAGGKLKPSLKATVSTAASGISFGTFTQRNTDPRGGPPPVSVNVTLAGLLGGYSVTVADGITYAFTENIFGEVTDAYLNDRNEVIITVQLGVSLTSSFFATNTIWSYPIVVNLTQDVVLFNGLDTAPPLAPGALWDARDIDTNSLTLSYFFALRTPYVFLLPLPNAKGDATTALAGAFFPKTMGVTTPPPFPFVASLCSFPGGAIKQTIANTTTTGADAVWLMSANQRYAMYSVGKFDTPTTFNPPIRKDLSYTMTADSVHVLDFKTPGTPDTTVAASSTRAQALYAFDPVLLSPSRLYLVNSKPADIAQTDLRNTFAKFTRSGTPIVKATGARRAGALQRYSRASKHIPKYLADFVEDPRPSVNLARILGSLKYKAIPGGPTTPVIESPR